MEANIKIMLSFSKISNKEGLSDMQGKGLSPA